MVPDKIILSTNAPKGKGLAWYYFNALKDLVQDKKVVILSDQNRNYNASILERSIRKINYEFGTISSKNREQIENELIDGQNLVLLFNNSDLLTRDIRSLSENRNIILANYYSDHPYALSPKGKETAFQSIPLFDMIFTFARDLIPVFYSHGAKSVKRIPFGYCKYTHLEPTKNVKIEYPKDVFYFGTRTEMIENWLSEIDLDINLIIEGNGWSRATNRRIKEIGTKKHPKTDESMSVYARKAGAVINFTRAPHGCFHTMKTFELAIAGAAIITNYSREQFEFFDDRAFLYFNTKFEMNDRIQSALTNPDLNAALRENAYNKALPHSYHQRSEQLLTEINSI